MKSNRILCLLLAAACLLSGCTIRTVDEMYCLPKRSESYLDLQSVVDEAMVDAQYCAPLTGENRQPVQLADLDGDGQDEYLLFARGDDELPLKILIFDTVAEKLQLCQTIEGNGTAFDLVEYAQIDGEGGVELVVGWQLSGQVPRSVAVYSLQDGQLRQWMSTQYTKFLPCDLDRDENRELLVIRPGSANTDNGIVELYDICNGGVERSCETFLSAPVEQLRRIITGNLLGGQPAVFVASAVEESAIITDIYALVDGQLANVTRSGETGTDVQTLRNYYVYAEDINKDGVVELPDLITMMPVDTMASTVQQHLIRWYAIAADGTEESQRYTFHNFLDGWYLELEDQWASRISVVQDGRAYRFYLWDAHYTEASKIFTVYVLTGQDRETQAVQDNRFVLHKTESIIYAARMEVASGAIELSQTDLITNFHLIRQDWNTGEM